MTKGFGHTTKKYTGEAFPIDREEVIWTNPLLINFHVVVVDIELKDMSAGIRGSTAYVRVIDPNYRDREYAIDLDNTDWNPYDN
jgi:hypothetical protein